MRNWLVPNLVKNGEERDGGKGFFTREIFFGQVMWGIMEEWMREEGGKVYEQFCAMIKVGGERKGGKGIEGRKKGRDREVALL